LEEAPRKGVLQTGQKKNKSFLGSSCDWRETTLNERTRKGRETRKD